MSSERFHVIDEFEEVAILVSESAEPIGDTEVVDALWGNLKAQRPSLFNGGIYYLNGYEIEKNILTLTGVLTEYKYYATGQLSDVEGNLLLVLAVTGITYFGDGERKIYIFGVRSDQCFHESKRIELVPSGSIDPEACTEKTLSYASQLSRELYEETGIMESRIISIRPEVLILDREGGTADLCCLIEIMQPPLGMTELLKSTEYERFITVEQDSLGVFLEEYRDGISPLTALLLKRLRWIV